MGHLSTRAGHATVAALTAAPGGIHLTIAGDHFGESTQLAGFFFVTGLMQVVVAVALVARHSRLARWIAFTTNVGLASLWSLSIVGAIDSLGGAEKASIEGISATCLEVAAAVVSVTVLRPSSMPMPSRSPVLAGLVVTLALALGAAVVFAAPAHIHGPEYGRTPAGSHAEPIAHVSTRPEGHEKQGCPAGARPPMLGHGRPTIVARCVSHEEHRSSQPPVRDAAGGTPHGAPGGS